MQAQYQRLAPRIGPQRAAVAVGHSRLRIVHRVLREGKAYTGPGVRPLSEKRRRKKIQFHRRCLQRLTGAEG